MMKCRIKTPHNGRESLIVGLTYQDLTQFLCEGVVMIDGESLGLGPDKAVVLLVGEEHGDMVAALEANLPVKFPRDEAGELLTVNA